MSNLERITMEKKMNFSRKNMVIGLIFMGIVSINPNITFGQAYNYNAPVTINPYAGGTGTTSYGQQSAPSQSKAEQQAAMQIGRAHV